MQAGLPADKNHNVSWSGKTFGVAAKFLKNARRVPEFRKQENEDFLVGTKVIFCIVPRTCPAPIYQKRGSRTWTLSQPMVDEHSQPFPSSAKPQTGLRGPLCHSKKPYPTNKRKKTSEEKSLAGYFCMHVLSAAFTCANQWRSRARHLRITSDAAGSGDAVRGRGRIVYQPLSASGRPHADADSIPDADTHTHYRYDRAEIYCLDRYLCTAGIGQQRYLQQQHNAGHQLFGL